MTSYEGVEGPPTRCRSCGAPVRWVRTERDKLTPLDAEPVLDGEWVVDADGVARLFHLFSAGQPRYRVHWANCPDAEDWRREK